MTYQLKRSLFLVFLAKGLLLSEAIWPASTARASDQAAVPAIARRIVVLGDSITAGYGLQDPLNQTYPALLQKKIGEAGLPYKMVNAGVSGDTTAGGLGRIRWAMKGGADILILALGGNDGLRGIDPQVTASNLSGIIRTARQINPELVVLVAGMKMPDSMGAAFARSYAGVFPEVAKRENAVLIPYFLEGVGGIASFNQPDRIHPTIEGQQLIAENIWKILRPVLKSGNASPAKP